MLKENDKIGIVACSNALPIQAKSSIHELEKILKRHQLEPVFSQYIYQTKDYTVALVNKRRWHLWTSIWIRI